MQIAGIKTISPQTDDTSSLQKHFPVWGLAASPFGCGSPSDSNGILSMRQGDLGVLQQQFTPKKREGGVMEDVGDKSWAPPGAV